MEKMSSISTLFLAEANKLKNIQLYLEKNDTLFNHLSTYGCEFNLLDYFVEVEKRRKNDCDQINHELKNIWRLLQEKKQFLKQGHVNALDVHSFKQDMIELQDKIYTLKMKLLTVGDTLKDEEKRVKEVNDIFNQKLEEWEKPAKMHVNRSSVPSKKISSFSSYHKEVLDFMDFVAKSNGHENGWSSEDHHLFLKLRDKYKNDENLALHLHKLLPDISVEDVKEHEAWYKTYLALKSEKDKAIQRWRTDKKTSSENKEITGDQSVSLTKIKVGVKPKDAEVYERIELWKAEKKAKRQQENINKQMKQEEQKRREEEKKRIRCFIKQDVMKWKETKTIRERFEKQQRQNEENSRRKIRAAVANKMIKEFQSQDDWFIAKMRSSKLKEDNQTVTRSKSSHLVERDPDRILKPTKQWILRTKKDNFVSECSSYVPNIRAIPKLKIPDWRKNKRSPET